MKKLLNTAILLLCSMTALADEAAQVENAMNWLSLVDSGEYAESWRETDPFFQSELSSEQWVKTLQQVRSPLGQVVSRDVQFVVQRESMPGAPEGDYAVITLQTNFEQMPSAIETVTLHQLDGGWKTVGYFIR